MSITASLAFSQLKRNRSRAIATIIAIALSTALLTAVCSFIVSGNAMLVELLGEAYGAYGGTYFVMLLIPTVILGILIIAMSVVVISNVFRISATERIAQFGTLKCVGATKRQIIKTIICESLFLSLIGIPIGILLGIILSYFGIGLVNIGLEHFNSLIHMMVNKITLSIQFIFSWGVVFLTVGIALIEVLISAYLPARKAAKVSAIDCIRRKGMVDISKCHGKTGWFAKRYFNIEALLAYKNVNRNRRNSRASVISLSISIILFLTLGGMRSIAENIESFIGPNVEQTVIVDYTSNYDKKMNSTTGREEVWFAKPIDSTLAEEVTQKLKSYDDTEFIGMGMDLQTYHTKLSREYISPQMLTALESEEEKKEYELSVEIIVVDKMNYEAICKKADVEPGATILLNHYKYNDNGDEANITPFSESLRTVSLEKGDGSIWEVPIDGMLTEKEIPADFIYMNMNHVRLIVPQADVRGYSWYSSPADIEGYMEYARGVMAEYFPEAESEDYMEAGVDTRVYETDDFMKVMNVGILIATLLMNSFVVLLAIIGVTNIISTMSTNVQMRLPEFAVLQSVGMTSTEIRKMLNMESIMCAGKALLYGLPIGMGMVMSLTFFMRKLFPMAYCIPWSSIVISIVVVFLVVWSIIRITARKILKQNIIETIRAERI